ncbi:MAG TPA: DNA primase [Kiritimatiellia bacterium]|nr:DNA primase [Kiritimatiellia bacterium]HRU20267.1 DNA primase [Kiritimatiellia bacterium]
MAVRITESVVEEIRARVDIVDVIGSRVPLKKAGASFKACCPFHHEKTPSFTVNPTRQSFYCFGCGEKGDVFSFVMKQDGLTFADAVKAMAERVGVVLQDRDDQGSSGERAVLYAAHAAVAEYYRQCLLNLPEAEHARRYLAQRKLSDEIVKSFGIGYAPEHAVEALLNALEKNRFPPEVLVRAGILCESDRGGPGRYFDRFHGRLMFPIWDRQGRVVAFSGRLLTPRERVGKYVNSPETPIFTKSRVLYALHKASGKIVKHPRREAIVCEGQIDVIRCHASGFETAVASQGTAFTRDHVKLLKRYADNVTLVFDGDAAGRKAALHTGTLFLEEEIPVRVACLPVGEDPDSILRDQGPEPFRDLLERAVSLIAFQIETQMQDEPNPEAIDAVSRVARGVIGTLATCPGGVLRTLLLQEAGERLHLPYSALEKDLEKQLEVLSRKAALAQTFKTDGGAADPSGERREEQCAGSGPSPEYNADPDIDPAFAPPSRLETLLCECLIEHERDPAVFELVSRYLPLDLITHPFARDLVAVLLRQVQSGEDMLAGYYQQTIPEWIPLFDRLLAHKQKMLCAREMTQEDAVQDLIRQLWIDRLKAEQQALGTESSPECDARRYTLSLRMKALRNRPWAQVCDLLAELGAPGATGSGIPAEAASAGAESCAHATDSASAVSDPEEFPPSAYLPDEMPD